MGENFESKYLKEDCQTVQAYLKEGHKLYQAAIAFYVRGKDEKELRTRSRQLRTILLSNNLEPVKENAEIAPLNSYLRWLPMNFNPQMDAKSHYYTKYYLYNIWQTYCLSLVEIQALVIRGLLTLIEEELRLISIRLTVKTEPKTLTNSY